MFRTDTIDQVVKLVKTRTQIRSLCSVTAWLQFYTAKYWLKRHKFWHNMILYMGAGSDPISPRFLISLANISLAKGTCWGLTSSNLPAFNQTYFFTTSWEGPPAHQSKNQAQKSCEVKIRDIEFSESSKRSPILISSVPLAKNGKGDVLEPDLPHT